MRRGSPSVKVACRVCHDRRVKCDRSEGIACSNCRNAGRECEPIISRRGRRRKLPLLSTRAGPSSRSLSPVTHNVPDGRLIWTTSTPSSSSQYVQSNREKQQQDPCFPAIGMNGKTPYVGDSSNLNYLIQQFGNPFGGATDARPLQDRLQGAMLARLGKSTTQQIERLRVSTLEHLQKQGIFDLPSQETSQALLDAYFHSSFTALPILDRSRFLATIEEGSFSHLLLNAIYLAATAYCSDAVISEAGFVSRYAASHTFYQRAKALYDAGYETDAITTVQATFLICHWWSGLLEHKDPWYWLGISAGLAQALGMHQARSYIRLDENDRKTWRRLWWILYAMDINLSMLLDLPPHVQGRLCNVPPLSEADFEQVNGLKEPETIGGTPNEANIFVINSVQLARTVDRFFAIQHDEESAHLHDGCLEQISLWSSSLPSDYKSLSTTSSIWAILTHILYQEYRLVLHRSNPRFTTDTGPGSQAFEICTDISHMLEILIAKDLVYATAGNIIAPVLSVLSIHIVNIRRGDAGLRIISENRAHLCMGILDKLQDRMPLVATFYPIYESLLKRHSVGAQRRDGTEVSDHPATEFASQEATLQLDKGNDHASMEPSESLFDQALQDSMSATLPFSFPFGSLFEDFFLSPSSQPIVGYCDDEESSAQ